MAWTRNVKISVQLILGLFLALSAVFSYLGAPYLVEYIAKKDLTLTPESITYENWKKTTIPIHFRVYFFNVTNAKNITDLHHTPHVVQVGPYTFLESREKVNITWNRENGTVSYAELKKWVFLPLLSTGTLDDIVVHVNVPMISAAHDVRRRGGDNFMYATIEAVYEEGALLFPNHTVKELLFEGYADTFLQIAISFGEEPPYDKFGFFYRRNDTVSGGKFRIFTGETNTMDKFGFLNTWNDKTNLSFWRDSTCNAIDKSTPGDFRPPFPRTRPQSVNVFVADICRSLGLNFAEQVKELGLTLDRYWLSNSAFQYSTGTNRCYCAKNSSCPPDGLMDISPCSFGSPIFFSLPHFLYSEKSLTDAIHGLSPDPQEHIFYIDYEPTLGVPVVVNARVQINVLIAKDTNLAFTSEMKRDRVYFPLIWTETAVTLDEAMIDSMKLFQMVPKIIHFSVILEVLLAGIILVSAFCQVLRWKQETEVDVHEPHETITLGNELLKEDIALE